MSKLHGNEFGIDLKGYLYADFHGKYTEKFCDFLEEEKKALTEMNLQDDVLALTRFQNMLKTSHVAFSTNAFFNSLLKEAVDKQYILVAKVIDQKKNEI